MPDRMKPWLLHAFSLDMLPRGDRCLVEVLPVDGLPIDVEFRPRIGQPAVAKLVALHLGYPDRWRELFDPGQVLLADGDTAYVARFHGAWPRDDQDLAPFLDDVDYYRVVVQ